MSEGGQNWGKKGSCLGKFAIGFIMFILLLIWVYMKNGEFLN